jgi:hypothetical protein
MNILTKIYLIIIILILSFLRTFVDIFRNLQFPTYKHATTDKERNIYNMYVYFKKCVDIPIVVLSFILLVSININISIYLFIFILFINLIIDYNTFIISDKKPTKLQIFIDKYVNLWFDIFLNVVITYMLYKLFKFK